MNLETGFTAVMTRLNTILPAAVQTAEVMARILPLSENAGAQKRAAVLQVATQAAMDAAAGAAIPIPDEVKFARAIGELVDAHVSMLKVFQVSSSAAAAGLTPTAAADVEPLPATGQTETAGPLAHPAGLDSPPVAGEDWREVDGVRYVWDLQSGRWASAGR